MLVVTPTYNEVENLPAFAQRLFEHVPQAHLLIVDDASPDGTGRLAEQMAQTDARIHILHRPDKRGLGTAYIDGFHYAMDHDYDLIFEMDADLSHDAAHLPRFCQAIAQGADVVIGSRYVPGGEIIGWGWGRRCLSSGGSLYARMILGLKVRDLTTGFKAYRRDALKALGLRHLKCDGYAFQIETTYRAIQAGLHITEVPISFVDRRVGQSKLSYRVFWEAVFSVWRMRLNKRSR